MAVRTGEVLSGRDWPRRYPPLLVIGVVLVLAVFTLPSALNLPQTSPSQLTEYAPVPGSSNSSRQAGGNIAGLGLGEGGNPIGAGGINDLLPPPGIGGYGTTPSAKQCVGNPPRQTEDPLAPPCVAAFTGDNGGSTYLGVTKNKIDVVFYFWGTGAGTGSRAGCGNGNENTPAGNRYYNLDDPPSEPEYCLVHDLRVWNKYFNARYQTYGRHVRFWVYFVYIDVSPGNPPNPPAAQGGQAADNINKVHPFAFYPDGDFSGNSDAYQAAMVGKGVMEFSDGSGLFLPQSIYRKDAPLRWTFAPSMEEQAQNQASFICQQIIRPGTTTFAGSFPKGTPRVYGLAETSDAQAPEHRRFQDAVAGILKDKCGVTFKDTVYYPTEGAYEGYASTDPQRQADYNSFAPPAMANFMQEGITTIIWPTGSNVQPGRAASKIGYIPEWVTGGGDALADGNLSGSEQDQTEWQHAINLTPHTWTGTTGTPEDCHEAWNATETGDTAAAEGYACSFYPSLRQLFTGIQVAGPKLAPQAVNLGFHAIPPHPSSTPIEPACFYDPGDYSCVKDGAAMWWDPTAPNITGGINWTGCWRMFQAGKRYYSWTWPNQDVWLERDTGKDFCNGLAGGFNFGG